MPSVLRARGGLLRAAARRGRSGASAPRCCWDYGPRFPGGRRSSRRRPGRCLPARRDGAAFLPRRAGAPPGAPAAGATRGGSNAHGPPRRRKRATRSGTRAPRWRSKAPADFATPLRAAPTGGRPRRRRARRRRTTRGRCPRCRASRPRGTRLVSLHVRAPSAARRCARSSASEHGQPRRAQARTRGVQ